MFESDDNDPVHGLEEFIKKMESASEFAAMEAHRNPVADQIMPSVLQRAIVPGDCVTISSVHGKDCEHAGLGVVLDPEDHVDEFPDWEIRIMKSYMLTRWYARNQLAGEIGWHPRAALIMFPTDRWDEMKDLLENPKNYDADDVPEWLTRQYITATEEIAKVNVGQPMPVRCVECNSNVVEFITETKERCSYVVGTLPEKANSVFQISKYLEKRDSKYTFRCIDCGHIENRTEDDLELYILGE